MRIFTRFFPDQLKPYAGRIVMTVFGFLIALFFLTIGFWQTILILVLSLIGYVFGRWEDGALDINRLPIPSRWK